MKRLRPRPYGKHDAERRIARCKRVIVWLESVPEESRKLEVWRHRMKAQTGRIERLSAEWGVAG